MTTTEENKILSAFEKYKGYSSNMFDNEEWRECDAFGAGVKFALNPAAEKAELTADSDMWSDVDKDSILNCLKE